MKRMLLIGASGLIGSRVKKVCKGRIAVLSASLNNSDLQVDISKPNSLKGLFKKVGEVEGIVCAAGLASFVEWNSSSDDDWSFAIANKMMGQINVIRFGESIVCDGGAIVVTTGLLSKYPMIGSGIISTVNAAVEAAVRSAALELNGRIRVNAVSPGWITETMEDMGIDSESGLPADEVASCFIKQFETGNNGSVEIAAKI